MGISVDPAGRSKPSIYDYIEDTFSAHLAKDRKLVRSNIDLTLQDMVERFQNVININLTGVYKLKDRREGDPKRPPPGMSWGAGKKRMLAPIRPAIRHSTPYSRDRQRVPDLAVEVRHAREEKRRGRTGWGNEARSHSARGLSGGRGRSRSPRRRSRSPRGPIGVKRGKYLIKINCPAQPQPSIGTGN